MFTCTSCGRDTLTRPHKPTCAVLIEQTRETVKKLGIGFRPDQFQLPLRLGET